MKTVKEFIGNIVSKIPGINDLVLSIVNLTVTMKELCGAVNELLASRQAHEAAILELYARQGVMMRVLNPDEGKGHRPAPKPVEQPTNVSKVSKPNLGGMINDNMPANIASFLKKYWSHLLLVVVLVASTLVIRSQKSEFVNDMQKVQEAHVVEIQKIQDARVEERKQLEANVKKLEQTLSIVQQQYDSAKKDLDAKKKKEVEEIIELYKDDPETLAKKLSESTGFQIILPELRMKKLFSFLLLLTYITFTFPVMAEPTLIPDAPPPVAGEIDVGAAISPMKKNQIAPFTGVLMSPKAVATLIAEFNNLPAKLKLETDKARAEEKAKSEFSVSELTIRSTTDKKILEAQLEERDKRIVVLTDQVVRTNSANSSPTTWGAIGACVGLVTGILVTTAAVFAVNKASK